MAKGTALCIGLNSVDATHYQGWSGELLACEADATDMAALANERGFGRVTTLLTADATRGRISDEITRAAGDLQSGDIFLLTYSGHGGQLPDRNGDEIDLQDETWCLYDGELVDDELFALLAPFRAGTRVLVLSDSCHSGTMTRQLLRDSALRSGALPGPPRARALTGAAVALDPTAPRFRAMPDDVAEVTYRRNRDFYDAILEGVPDQRESERKLQAAVRLISGCQDNQLSRDGNFNGLFTGTLLRVWNRGAFRGDYRDFHREIVNRMPSDQTPNHFVLGPPNVAFDGQQPFGI